MANIVHVFFLENLIFLVYRDHNISDKSNYITFINYRDITIHISYLVSEKYTVNKSKLFRNKFQFITLIVGYYSCREGMQWMQRKR